MDMGLGGRVAAVARALAQEGCRVALCSRDLKRARRAAQDIAAETGADVLAQTVAFLASEKASYITGVALQVDGGKVTSPF